MTDGRPVPGVSCLLPYESCDSLLSPTGLWIVGVDKWMDGWMDYKKDAINLSNFMNYIFHLKGYNNNIIPVTIYYNISLQPLVSLSGTLDNFSVYWYSSQ